MRNIEYYGNVTIKEMLEDMQVVRNGFDYGLQVYVKDYIIQECGHTDKFRQARTKSGICCNAYRLRNQGIRNISHEERK